jgi:hypothetical protein
MDDRRNRVPFPIEKRGFDLLQWLNPLSIESVPGAFSSRSRSESHQSIPSTIEVKNTWIYTSGPPSIFMA